MAAVEAARAFACGRGPQQIAAEQMGTEHEGTLDSSDVPNSRATNSHLILLSYFMQCFQIKCRV